MGGSGGSRREGRGGLDWAGLSRIQDFDGGGVRGRLHQEFFSVINSLTLILVH